MNSKTSKRVNEIRQSILKLNTELIRLQPKLEHSKTVNIKYNKILIQKAELKKELDDLQKPLLKTIFGFLKKKKEKSICDYFAS